MNWLNALESISIIAASIAASLGIFSWRSTERWKRKYELAEDVLSKFYESREIIKIIRSPFGIGGEGKSRERNNDETPEERAIYDRAYVVFERYENNKDVIEKLFSLRFRFISHFGKENEKLFNELFKIRNDVFSAAREIASIRLGEYDDLTIPEKGKKMRELNNIIYWTHKSDDDPIETRFNKLINDVEGVCKKIIGRK
jgi:hypothetical protein